MTALQLLALIVAAMLLQLGAGIGWTLWRRRSGTVSVPATPSGALPERGTRTEAAWQGLRAFRVTKREDEDTARSQCSFHLQPVDAALPGVNYPELSATTMLSGAAGR